MQPALSSLMIALALLQFLTSLVYSVSLTANDSAFIDWSGERGVHLSRVSWPNSFAGLGVKKDVKPSQTFLRVPMHNVISTHLYSDHVLGKVVWNTDSNFRGLIVVVMLERLKGENSSFAPYLNTLPTHFSSTLAYWEKEEIDELQDPFLVGLLRNEKQTDDKNFTRFYDLMNHFKEPFSHIGMNSYLWAKSVVLSRSIVTSGERVMVPFIDVVTRREGEKRANARLLIKPHEHFALRATKPIKASSQVVIVKRNVAESYSNLHFLRVRGYVPKGNARNSEPYPFQDLTKRALYGTLPFGRLFLKIKPIHTLRFFRLTAAKSDAELRDWKRSVSWERDRKAFVSCKESIQKHMRDRAFTSVGRDIKLLRESTGRLRNAILYRIERKKVLLRHIAFCREVSKSMKCLAETRVFGTIKYFRLLFKLASAQSH